MQLSVHWEMDSWSHCLNEIKRLNYVNLFGVRYAATDYAEAGRVIVQKSLSREPFAVTALAVHGLIESYRNKQLKEQVNSIDLVLPDGQPIRWALNIFHRAGLRDRVYGPTLMLNLLDQSAHEGLSIFLYGSKQDTLDRLATTIRSQFPTIEIAGMQADRFRDSTEEERKADIEAINTSGARLIFVGRGCPRQEQWIAQNKNDIKGVLIAVGAAFDFHAGTVKQAPNWMQERGLEWLFRLIQEPGRLWKRYLVTNSWFLFLFTKQLILKPFNRNLS